MNYCKLNIPVDILGLPVKGSLYGNLELGNEDKLMISYHRDLWSHDYSMNGACGVVYDGEMHFFGGFTNSYYEVGDVYSRQHFTIEMKRSGRMVRMTRQHNLGIEFKNPSCSTFEISSQYFPWLPKNIVVLCFDMLHKSSCYSFDGNSIGKISNKSIGNSNFEHFHGGLIKYKQNLLTVGGTENQKTEILERNINGTYIWSPVEPDFAVTKWGKIEGHSLVNMKSSHISEEFILLSGGIYDPSLTLQFMVGCPRSGQRKLDLRPRYRIKPH